MSFLQFFKVRTPKPTHFRYTPQYYDENAEKKRKRNLNRENLSDEERRELMREDFSSKVGRTRKTVSKNTSEIRSQESMVSNIRLLLIILVLGYVFYYFFNKMDNLAGAIDIIKNR